MEVTVSVMVMDQGDGSVRVRLFDTAEHATAAEEQDFDEGGVGFAESSVSSFTFEVDEAGKPIPHVATEREKKLGFKFAAGELSR